MNKWRAPGREFTHLVLTGGRLAVGDAQADVFLTEYARAVDRGDALHLVERRTPVFRMFMDMDFAPPPPPEIVTAAVQAACAIAGEFFEYAGEAVVLRKDAEAAGKVGVHVTWDGVYATSETALAFRARLCARLEEAHPLAWGDVIDPSVYAGSGLRMPWSAKAGAPGVYRPTEVCTAAGALRPAGVDATAAWVRRCAIRAPGAVPSPSAVAADAAETSCARATSLTLAAHAATLEAVRATVPQAYGAVEFTGMHPFGDACMVLRTACRRCANKAGGALHGAHASSTVYFVVLRRGVAYQRCYSRKEGRGCAEFASDAWPVARAVVDAWWPPPTALEGLLARTRPPLKKKKCR